MIGKASVPIEVELAGKSQTRLKAILNLHHDWIVAGKVPRGGLHLRRLAGRTQDRADRRRDRSSRQQHTHRTTQHHQAADRRRLSPGSSRPSFLGSRAPSATSDPHDATAPTPHTHRSTARPGACPVHARPCLRQLRNVPAEISTSSAICLRDLLEMRISSTVSRRNSGASGGLVRGTSHLLPRLSRKHSGALATGATPGADDVPGGCGRGSEVRLPDRSRPPGTRRRSQSAANRPPGSPRVSAIFTTALPGLT
jgi:hypothetical protein